MGSKLSQFKTFPVQNFPKGISPKVKLNVTSVTPRVSPKVKLSVTGVRTRSPNTIKSSK